LIKKTSILLILIFLTGLLGGCWDRRELAELAIVLGAGVDRTSEGRIRLTVQIARPSAFFAPGGGGGGGGGEAPGSWVVWAEGETIEDAGRHLTLKVPREIYWGHSIILVIGEDMARKGTRLVTDFFHRNRQPRETTWLMVAKGEAKDFLEAYSALEKTSAQAAGFLARMKIGYSVQSREFAEMLASKGVQPVATRVEVKRAGITPGPGGEKEPSKQKQVVLTGVAVFREDKLIGWLDENETRGLLWLKGEVIRRDVVVVPTPGEPAAEASIKIRRAKTTIMPDYDGARPRFNVIIEAEGDMLEQQSREDLATPEKIKALEGAMAGEIRKKATGALEKAQRVYGVDIFGFGDAFHRKYKKEWRKLKNRWDREFTRAEVNISVKARVRDTGLLTRQESAPEE
jgi:spore germination protein KC